MNCPHCQTPIDEHKVSRCLDVWIEDVVIDEDSIWIPDYSTDISAAWKILDKFFRFQVGTDGMIYLCEIEPAPKKKFLAGADEAPLAICRAALKAVANV